MSTKFADFLRVWIVEHKTSSPQYAQFNGKAEATVKTTKKLNR